MAALVLRRLLISSRQTESLICGRSPQQPLATWSERFKRWSSGTKVLSISCGLESFNVSMLVCFNQKQTGDTATEPETSSSSGGEAQEVKSEVSQSTTKQETAEDDIEVLLQEKDEKIKQLQVRSLKQQSHFMSTRYNNAVLCIIMIMIQHFCWIVFYHTVLLLSII